MYKGWLGLAWYCMFWFSEHNSTWFGLVWLGLAEIGLDWFSEFLPTLSPSPSVSFPVYRDFPGLALFEVGLVCKKMVLIGLLGSCQPSPSPSVVSFPVYARIFLVWPLYTTEVGFVCINWFCLLGSFEPSPAPSVFSPVCWDFSEVGLVCRNCWAEVKRTSSQAPSYASPKLCPPAYSLTGVKCRATSAAKNKRYNITIWVSSRSRKLN